MEKLKKLFEIHGESFRQKLLEPIFFINEIIGFDNPSARLTPYQEEWIDLIERNDRINFMAFRSSGKTECLLIDYPIFKAFTQSGWQGIIISNSQKQSVSIIRRIRERILGSELLRTSIPSGRDGLWSKSELQLKNKSIIWSRPNSENLAGEHIDYIGADEIGYWKDMDIITKVIPPMVRAKNGKIVFIGTPTSQTDAIHQLQKNPAFFSKSYPANLKDPNTGKTLWELRYPKIPMEEARKEYDSMSWSREFLLKPLSSKDKIYPYELISKCFDPESSFHTDRREGHSYFIGLDFALSGEAGADYTVYTVLEKKEDTCKIVNIERYKGMSYQAQKMRIKQLAVLYKPVKVIADEGSFGASFVQDLRADFVPVEGFKFTNQSKQELHTSLRNMFEQERLIISKNPTDSNTHNMTEMLVRELSCFGVLLDPKTGTVHFEGLGEHDDLVTSLALAAWGARGMGNVCWSVARGSESKKSSIFYMGATNF